jgi:hypothetical protein
VAVLFLDTDLYQSSLDALTALAPKMSPGTLLASDGISGQYDFKDGAFVPQSMEGKALVDFFAGTTVLPRRGPANGHMAVFKKKAAGSRLAYSHRLPALPHAPLLLQAALGRRERRGASRRRSRLA